MGQTRAAPSAWRYGVAFGIVYLGAVATVTWVTTSVLCLGDPKFDSGCGGWPIYFPVWAVMYLPAAGGAVTAAVQDRLRPRVQWAVLAACLVVALAWIFVSWLAGSADVGLAGGIVLCLAFSLAGPAVGRRFGGQAIGR